MSNSFGGHVVSGEPAPASELKNKNGRQLRFDVGQGTCPFLGIGLVSVLNMTEVTADVGGLAIRGFDDEIISSGEKYSIIGHTERNL